MKYIWLLGIVGAFSGLLFCFYFSAMRLAESDPLDQILTQMPDPAAIRRAIAAHAADKPPLTANQRQDLFANLFTQRFRKHESKMAIRARFVVGDESDDAAQQPTAAPSKDPKPDNRVRNRIKLMCPARMEPWNMDRLAMAAWREAKDCLGQPYDIDIYHTFIGQKPVKVGELRVSRANASYAMIRYSLAPVKQGKPLPAPPSSAPIRNGSRRFLITPPTMPTPMHAARLAHP